MRPAVYLKELKSELGLYPAWFPTSGVELGSYGWFQDGSFVRQGRLADLGISFQERVDPPLGNIFKHRGMQFGVDADADASAGSGSTVRMKLATIRKHAWLFAAGGTRKVEIDDIHQVNHAVREQYKARKWKRKWLLVTRIYQVDVLRVIVAESRNSTGEVSASSPVEGNAAAQNLLLSAVGSIVFGCEDVLIFQNTGKMVVPLFGLHRLRGLFAPSAEPAAASRVRPKTRAIPSLREASDEEMFPTQSAV